MKKQLSPTSLLILFFAVGCATSPKQEPKNKNVFYRVHCDILDYNLKTIRAMSKTSPCLFLKDGSFVHTDEGLKDRSNLAEKYDPKVLGLYRRDAEGKILWHLPGYYHHSLRLDSQGNILALTSEVKKLNSDTIRGDLVQKISPQGKVLAQFSFFKHAKDIFELRQDDQWSDNFWVNDSKTFAARIAKYEFSHANSFYEIPPEARAKFQNAYYLINDPVSAICMGLDENLTQIVWHQNMKPYAVIHDCQPLADGSILYLENHGTIRIDEKRYSRIVRVLNSKEVFSFPKEGRTQDYFIADTRGGVEVVPEGYMFSAGENGKTLVGVVSEEGKWVRKNYLPYMIQDIKILREPEFLEKNMIR